MQRLPPRRQGDLGELSAMASFAARNHAIYVPVGHSPTCDFIAERQRKLLQVQVKTSTRFRNGRWEVSLCTRGGNQSWSGIVKRLDPKSIDYLFVVVGNGRRWSIPAGSVEGGTFILLGGPKYAHFEVEPGSPLPQPEAGQSLSSASPVGCPSG
jgi:hypothetical protein